MARVHRRLSYTMDVSVSLHLGDLTDVPLAARLLAQEGIAITSLDRPDVYDSRAAIKDVGRFLAMRNSHEAMLALARRAHNVGTESGANKKIKQGVEAHRNVDGGRRTILRTQAGLWVDSNGVTGDRLRKSLKGTGVVIAVELFPSMQTQSEYRQLIENLAKDNGNETPIYYDLDLGHIAEANYWNARDIWILMY